MRHFAMNRLRPAAIGPMALAAMLAGGAEARAQEAETPSGGIEEIVVTAQKREQNLQDVPVSITAVSEPFMKANRIQTVVDLSAVTPNLNIRVAAAGGALPTVVLRGVLSYGVAPGSDKQVPIYIDGVYIGNAFGTQFEMADVERIEVLRGPQGTLFGRNATAGAISIVTKRPTGTFDLHQEFTYGNYDQFRAKTHVDLPALGPFKVALSYVHSERRGDIRNLGAGTTWDFTAGGLGRLTAAKWLGNDNTDAYSAAVLFAPEDSNFDILYKFDQTDNESTAIGSGVIAYNFQPTNIGAAAPLINALLATQPNPANLTATGATRRPKAVNNDFNFPSSVKTWGHTVTGNLRLSDALSVKNILAWRGAKVFGAQSLVGTGGLVNNQPLLGGSATNPPPLVLAGAITGSDFHQFSDELQFNYDSDWLTATAGVIHYKQHSVQGPKAGVRNIHFLQTYPNFVVPLAPSEAPADTRGRSQAAFIQLEGHVTPQLDVVGGYRITQDKKSFLAFGSTTTSGSPFTFKYKDTNDSYLLGVNYRPTDGVLTYAKFAHSFMSGGSSFSIVYDPEYVDSWEAGIKADLFDRRLRTNLALYTAKYEGVQLTTSGAAFGFPNIGIAVGNVGDARAKGFELEVTAVPVDRLTLSGGLGYTDFKYKNLTRPALLGDFTKPNYRPKWTANATVQYDTMPVVGDAFLRMRVDANYRSQQWLAANAGPALQPLLQTPGIVLLNSRVALTDIAIGGHKAEIALWGRNITNDDHMAFVNSYGFIVPAMYERARTFGVDVSFDW